MDNIDIQERFNGCNDALMHKLKFGEQMTLINVKYNIARLSFSGNYGASGMKAFLQMSEQVGSVICAA